MHNPEFSPDQGLAKNVCIGPDYVDGETETYHLTSDELEKHGIIGALNRVLKSDNENLVTSADPIFILKSVESDQIRPSS